MKRARDEPPIEGAMAVDQAYSSIAETIRYNKLFMSKLMSDALDRGPFFFDSGGEKCERHRDEERGWKFLGQVVDLYVDDLERQREGIVRVQEALRRCKHKGAPPADSKN